MKKETNKEFPFKIGHLYEYIGDQSTEFNVGEFYEYTGNNTFKSWDGVEYEFQNEWGEDDPLQESFKYI